MDNLTERERAIIDILLDGTNLDYDHVRDTVVSLRALPSDGNGDLADYS